MKFLTDGVFVNFVWELTENATFRANGGLVPNSALAS